MTDFSVWDILRNLLFASRWTIGLSLIAFACGGFLGLAVALLRISHVPALAWGARLFIEAWQGTPLLMQMFLCFFGLSLVGLDVPPLLAASIALTLFAAAFLGEIWRGCIQAVPRGQWEAAASQGLSFVDQCRHVIFPQALRIAIPPTVGFSVQLVKGTALASIIGFVEVTKAGTMITNATFRPFMIYGLVALIYFALCFPLSWHARRLERRVRVPH
jgi:polar amino acid transport system permease protein